MIYAYTRLRYQVSVYRTIGPPFLVFFSFLNVNQNLYMFFFCFDCGLTSR